jgi:hypothetical protein
MVSSLERESKAEERSMRGGAHAFFGALGGRGKGSPWGDACSGACKPVLSS